MRAVGAHLGHLASRDLARRVRDGLGHCADAWAERKRELTAESSSRWAGSVTANTHEQWGLSRRAQHAHLQSLDTGIRMVRHRLSLPVGQKGGRGRPGGYRSRREWFQKARRLAVLECRFERVKAEWEAGRVSVVRGGRRLLHQRHHLAAAGKAPERWRAEWEAARGFLAALRAGGVVGVDMNADHLAAWQLDECGNPVGAPRRFDYDLTGTATHRDAQLRHALTRLLHWARATGVTALAIEDLDFTDSTTREKHGRRKKFRRLISEIPTAKLRARLVGMCAEAGIGVIAVDPAYSSKWGAEHWQKPMTSAKRQTSRHAAAAVAIGRRALGHRIRRRAAPPRDDQSDRRGHRTTQAPFGTRGSEGHRPRVPGPRTRSVRAGHGRNAVDQDTQHRSGRPAEYESWYQGPLPLSSSGTVPSSP
ncbi:transposase [Streptomyces sp. NPDC127166]|uniref:transposase n=1 Tax=Streptomyces sp. NPDC127166 TaxID=3345380 RepID=UPI00363BBB67